MLLLLPIINKVRYLILGGKRIYSTSMTQEDYSSLVSESVDVESTMSFEMSVAVSASSQTKAGLVIGTPSAASVKSSPQSKTVGSIVNTGSCDADKKKIHYLGQVQVRRQIQVLANLRQARNRLKVLLRYLIRN